MGRLAAALLHAADGHHGRAARDGPAARFCGENGTARGIRAPPCVARGAGEGTLLVGCDRRAQFDEYLGANFTAKSKSFCIVTDGGTVGESAIHRLHRLTSQGWDLKQALMRECKKKDIILAPHYFRCAPTCYSSLMMHLKRFFDVKSAFMQTMKMTKPLSLKAMAMALGTPMEKHHSGIADCMTISHIVHQLVQTPVD